MKETEAWNQRVHKVRYIVIPRYRNDGAQREDVRIPEQKMNGLQYVALLAS
ncbi:MAG TPA: hypothetical protein VK957_14940 [Lunatimonas sp.]|nr:hypothetical protein [Lunatimonas sp.]